MEQEQPSISSDEPERMMIQYGEDATTVTFTQERIVDKNRSESFKRLSNRL